MPDLAGFRTFQKIRYFLAGALPFLARIGLPSGGLVARLLGRFPRLTDLWQRASASRLGGVGHRVASTFVLGHYTEDRLDWTALPRDAVAVLRGAVVLAALLCLLVPIAVQWPWPPLATEPISGTTGFVGGWSVALWFLAASLGWSALLAGTAAASQAALLPALLLFFYFGAAAVGALPKSWWSVLLPLQGAMALVFAEARAAAMSRGQRVGAAFAVLVAACLIAALTIVVIPTPPWFRGRLLVMSVATGIPLGIALSRAGEALARRASQRVAATALRLDLVVATLTAASLLLFVTLALRGGMATPAASIRSFAVEMTGFLWPLYYFVGAGVVFKVLRQTTTVQRVAESVLPARWFIPGAIALLTIALVVSWIKPVLLSPAFPWPAWLVIAAEALYRATEWLWRSALIRLAMDPLKWILLIAVLLAVWAALQRRLTSAFLARTLFVVTLCAFAIVEYYFQALGFVHAPRSSAFSLLIFASLVLWLVHRTVFPHLGRASQWWPAVSRLALYGALLTFTLLPIHARAALHDERLTSEIFLYLFAGSLNFGLPYYAYLYARRRFGDAAPSAGSALGSLLLGAALSLPLVVLDKIAVAGWSPAAAWSLSQEQAHALLAGQDHALDAFFPTGWILFRAALVVGSLAALAYLPRHRNDAAGYPRSVFHLLGVAAGLACFSNRGIELPLMPQSVTFLITPVAGSLIVDLSLVARLLGIMIPALILALGVARPTRTRWMLIVAAYATHSASVSLWPAQEAWLRSTSLVTILGGAGLAALVMLALAVRNRLSDSMPTAAADAPRVAFASWAKLRVVAAPLLLVMTSALAWRVWSNRAREHTIPGAAVNAWLPVAWTAADAPNESLTLVRRSWSGVYSTLAASAGGVTARMSPADLLRGVVADGAVEPLSVERWDRYYPGAIALHFRVRVAPDSTGVASFGTAVAAPLPNGRTVRFDMRYDAMDGRRKWDVARALRTLPRAASPAE